MSEKKYSMLLVSNNAALTSNLHKINRLIKPSLEFFCEGNLSTAQSVVYSIDAVLLFLDFDSFTSGKNTFFLQKFRKIRQHINAPIYLITKDLTESVLACSLDYNCTGIIPINNIQELVPVSVKEFSAKIKNPHDLEDKLLSLEQSKRNENLPEIQAKVLELYGAYSNDERVKIEYGNYCVLIKEYYKAEQIALNILSKTPLNLRATNLLVRCKFHLEKYDDALALIEDAEKLSPKNIDRLVLLGDIYRTYGDSTKAHSTYDEALAIDPDFKLAVVGKCKVALNDGHINQAIELVKSFANTYEIASLFNNSAIFAARKGDYKKAYHLYFSSLNALKNKTLKAKVYFNIGLSKFRQNKLQDACNLFTQALNINSDFAKAASRLQELNSLGYEGELFSEKEYLNNNLIDVAKMPDMPAGSSKQELEFSDETKIIYPVDFGSLLEKEDSPEEEL